MRELILVISYSLWIYFLVLCIVTSILNKDLDLALIQLFVGVISFLIGFFLFHN